MRSRFKAHAGICHSPGNLSRFSPLSINSTLQRIKQLSPLHAKMILALPPQDSLLVFRKNGWIAMESNELIDVVEVQLHDSLHQSCYVFGACALSSKGLTLFTGGGGTIHQ